MQPGVSATFRQDCPPQNLRVPFPVLNNVDERGGSKNGTRLQHCRSIQRDARHLQVSHGRSGDCDDIATDSAHC